MALTSVNPQFYKPITQQSGGSSFLERKYDPATGRATLEVSTVTGAVRGLSNTVYEDIKDIYDFAICELYNNNIELNWTKPDKIMRDITEKTGVNQVHIFMNLTTDILKKYKNNN